MPLFRVFNETGLKAVIGYFLLLLFLISYRQLYSTNSWKWFTYWLALQIGITVTFSLGYDPHLLLMGFYSANFVGWYTNKKHFHYVLIAFASAIIFTMISLSILAFLDNIFSILPFAIVMICSPFAIRSMNERMALEQQLSQANDQIKELIKREERVRIARDLHDTLGHTLSLITLQSQLVRRIAEKNPERVKVEAQEIEMTARSALRQVRELVSDMRAITITDEIVDMEQILKAANIQFHMEDKNEFPELPPLQQNILGMCLREAVTNIVKHSEAKNCFIIFGYNGGNFTISVKDDGNGIIDDIYEGNGLSGMRERLALIEGKLMIESETGTTVTMIVPIIIKEEVIA